MVIYPPAMCSHGCKFDSCDVWKGGMEEAFMGGGWMTRRTDPLDGRQCMEFSGSVGCSGREESKHDGRGWKGGGEEGAGEGRRDDVGVVVSSRISHWVARSTNLPFPRERRERLPSLERGQLSQASELLGLPESLPTLPGGSHGLSGSTTQYASSTSIAHHTTDRCAPSRHPPHADIPAVSARLHRRCALFSLVVQSIGGGWFHLQQSFVASAAQRGLRKHLRIPYQRFVRGSI